MGSRRPTFHESWHRVSDLRPRLRTGLHAYRQHFRGELWHVIQDPSNNSFFRLNDAAYRFLFLLTSGRTVDEAWSICCERDGDEAPTQVEVVQLLGQLYSSNLLHAEVEGDVEAILRRKRKRIAREVRSKLMSLLFVRIPLVDPDRFLKRWAPLVGWIFTGWGLALWCAVMVVGLFTAASHAEELALGARSVLAPGNLFLLYLSIAGLKLLHELGHGFACRWLGQDEGGGEVHQMGVMLMVFIPLPFVDATSSWAFRSKWRRALVGAAGMMVELAVAVVALFIWLNTAEGTALHAIAYNAVFTASVSTLLFNANPLLRYDGYYILSDLLEIPNLQMRSREYLNFLVKKRLWGVRNPVDPSHSADERLTLALYGVMSAVYRIFVAAVIILFVAGQLFFIGVLLALSALIGWVFVPLGRFLRYLGTSPELARTRPRAVLTTAGFITLVTGALGLIPAPDHVRAEGVVEPSSLAVIHMGVDGFVDESLASGSAASADTTTIMRAANPDLLSQRDALMARRRALVARRGQAREEDLALAQITDTQINALDEQIQRLKTDIEALNVISPIDGVWVSPDLEHARGSFLRRGEQIGVVASLDELVIRAAAPQSVGPMLAREATPSVRFRVRGRPDAESGGSIAAIQPAGLEVLPSAALGFNVGGAIATDASDPSGRRAAERVFEVRIAPDSTEGLLPGQRVIVRFDLGRKPLLTQAHLALRQLFQRRFQL